MKIMICGGIDDVEDELTNNIRIFGEQLARQVIRQNHTLVCGNLTHFDGMVINSACDELNDEAESKIRIKSYRPMGAKEFTDRGSVFNSKLDRWNQIGKDLWYPEPIHGADVIILVGGWDGTHTAANWARLAHKPILPVASFGQAAEEIYGKDREKLPAMFGKPAECDDFDILNRAFGKIDEKQAEAFASEIVSLAERMVLSRDVFIIMSYNEDEKLNEAYRAFMEVCEQYGFEGARLDQTVRGETYEITHAITDRIRECAFAIVDLTENRPNVYYELGFARGLGKRVILTAKKGTDVHFDVQGLQRLEWEGFLDLRDQLQPEVAKLAKDFGAD